MFKFNIDTLCFFLFCFFEKYNNIFVQIFVEQLLHLTDVCPGLTLIDVWWSDPRQCV